jgi:hypothetical protein
VAVIVDQRFDSELVGEGVGDDIRRDLTILLRSEIIRGVEAVQGT